MALAVSLLISFSANATIDTNRAITSIGAQGSSTVQLAYLVLTPAPSLASCGGFIYLDDLSTAAGKALYSTLLTAYSLGKALERVDYAPNAGGTCVISAIQVGQ